MKKFLIPLSIAALTVAAIGAGAVATPVQIAEPRLEYPTNDQENDVHSRQMADQRLTFPSNAEENDVHLREVAELTRHEEEYPAPSGDGDSPDIRFPGHPSV